MGTKQRGARKRRKNGISRKIKKINLKQLQMPRRTQPPKQTLMQGQWGPSHKPRSGARGFGG